MDTQEQETKQEAGQETMQFDAPPVGLGPAPSDTGAVAARSEEISRRLQDIETAIERIAGYLDQLERAEQSRDFSLSHLLGAVVQVVALAFMAWALLAFLRATPDFSTSMLALLAAIATQLLALTLFSSARRT